MSPKPHSTLSNVKKEVLVLAHYYMPSKHAGGPPKSVANLIDVLKGGENFKILTCDHEFNSHAKLEGIESEKWMRFEGNQVFYQNDSFQSLIRTARESLSPQVRVLYLNSFFDPRYAILPVWIAGLASRKRIVLAPRGELSVSALELKGFKKKCYLAMFSLFRLHHRVVWQASSLKEEEELKSHFGNIIKTVLLPNFPTPFFVESNSNYQKKVGSLRLVYLARISRIKNTKFAIEALKSVHGDVQLDIYGPLEDEDYWADCLKAIDQLPPNIRVEYKGTVAPDSATAVISQYDAYVLPTLSESFGHSIFEAIAGSVPVVLSTFTPWRNLRALKAGYDVELDGPAFSHAIQELVDMDLTSIRELRLGSLALAKSLLASEEHIRQAKELFLINSR